MKVDLEITNSLSLKDKRMVLKSLKDRIRKNFNVSISEVDYQDKWQKAALGLACVSGEKQFVDTTFQKIINYIERERSVMILNSEMEIC